MLAELGIGATGGAVEAPIRSARPAVGYGCGCPDCAAAQWNMQRLKYWLCGRLLAYGADEAEVDRLVGGVPVDVYWRKGDREYAIEVRSGPLECALAQEHTDRLRAAGCAEVLWLCQPGYWVGRLHAMGMTEFAAPGCDYRASAGVFGIDNGLVAPRSEPLELREFIRGWVTGEIVWGYRDEHTGGWATVPDWEQHTKTQATLLARQRQELVDQRTALAVSRKAMRDKHRHALKLATRLERSEQIAQDRADSLAQAHRKIDDEHRVQAMLRDNIGSLRRNVGQLQLVAVCAMLLIVTFIAAAMVVR
ncbi:hypothetical protein GCM10023318_31140 [Nocardia callitridis]|uniref:Uncharacterized protein n=2 Tax=Nocardia callitridis TaxID=648753 RepID=A0ABP9KEZ3_9NOCA